MSQGRPGRGAKVAGLSWFLGDDLKPADIPIDPATGKPEEPPLGYRHVVGAALAPKPPKVKGRKKQLSTTLRAPDAFPSVIGRGTPAARRVAELLTDPGLLDGRRAVALSAVLLEVAMSDGVKLDDLRIAKMLDGHTRMLIAAHKQAATQAVLKDAAVPVFERIGGIMADVIGRYVPATHREVALNELRLRLREALESAATAVVKESGALPDP